MNSELKSKLKNFLKEQDDSRQLRGQIEFPWIRYGTSGFRGPADKIDHLFCRIGLVAGLRCLQVKKNIGIMITASHNPIQDNGVKLIDADGCMFDSSWESIVEKLCNNPDPDAFIEQLDRVAINNQVSFETLGQYRILVGIDTRPSSEALASLVISGIKELSPLLQYINFNLLTTPALHYLVAESNLRGTDNVDLDCYFSKLLSGMSSIFEQKIRNQFYLPSQLVVDCANGVGRETMVALCNNIKFYKYLPIKLINIGDGILNKSCGADFVKTHRTPPTGADDPSKRYASLDGDADRVIYFYLDDEQPDDVPQLRVLDGDKIMSLIALYLKEVLKMAQLEEQLTFGAVQTAYANGSSTDFLKNSLNLEVVCADTGIKNLQKQAFQFDIGLYFESNGHGTIWVSQRARDIIEERDVQDLKRLLAILNDYMGDAISDILIVETILRSFDWDIQRWNTLYRDRPNSMLTIEIEDRNVIETFDAGRKCAKPDNLQPSIDAIVNEFGRQARCFVRPSGTEDLVRIYAEAEDQASADRLAKSIAKKTIEICAAVVGNSK